MDTGDYASQSAPAIRTLQMKIRIVVALSRVAACCYLLWVLWLVLAPLRAPDQLVQWLQRVWRRELAGLDTWQLSAYFTIDLLGWLMCVAALVCCWRAMGTLAAADVSSADSKWRYLTTGAWLALGAEGYSLLTRPVKSYVMTLNDPAPPLVAWSFAPQDFLVTMLCLALLVLAYVAAWKSQLADENRGFV